MTAEPRRLGIEVDFESEPIEGRVYQGDDDGRPFSGWLGLMSAIEGARKEEEPDVQD